MLDKRICILWLGLALFLGGCPAPQDGPAGPPPDTSPLSSDTIDATVNLAATGFQVTEYREDRTIFQLSAERVSQLQSGEAPIEDITLVFFDNNKQSLELVAERGIFYTTTKDIHLEGNVIATGLLNPVRFFTESLDWDHRNEELTTEARVRVEREGMVMTGTGLVCDVTLERLQIQKDIRGEMR